VKYYSLPLSGGELESKKGLFSKHCATRIVLCVAFLPNSSDAVTGQDNGSLYLWKGRTCTLIRTGVHRSAVRSIAQIGKGSGVGSSSGAGSGGGGSAGGVVSGGDDGLVIIWNENLQPIFSFDMHKDMRPEESAHAIPKRYCLGNLVTRLPLLSTDPRVTSVDCVGDLLVIATAGSEVYEINRSMLDEHNASGGGGGLVKITEGHSKGEVWALATHPVNQHMATGGDDGKVRLWDLQSHQVIARVTLPGRVRALAFSPNGSILVAGLHTGYCAVMDVASVRATGTGRVSSAWQALEAESLSRFMVHVCQDWIVSVSFSDDGGLLAVGSYNGTLYVLKPANGYQRSHVFRSHGGNGGVTHIDFSLDNNYLCSNSSPNEELMFWDLRNGKRMNARDCGDIVWATHSCVFGWQVAGMWQPQRYDKLNVEAFPEITSVAK